jgi:hypothetical protein
MHTSGITSSNELVSSSSLAIQVTLGVEADWLTAADVAAAEMLALTNDDDDDDDDVYFKKITTSGVTQSSYTLMQTSQRHK